MLNIDTKRNVCLVIMHVHGCKKYVCLVCIICIWMLQARLFSTKIRSMLKDETDKCRVQKEC